MPVIRTAVGQAGRVASGPSPTQAPNGGRMNPGGIKSWSPTVANLLVLVLLEIVAYHAIRYVFSRVSD